MRTTQKAKDKRKKERECLSSFFNYHLPKISVCENCNLVIRDVGHKNVAHILPKSKLGGFPEVMCNKDNAMYLCTDLDRQDGKGCHEKYDSGWESAKSLQVWDIAVKRFKKFEKHITTKSTTLLNFWNSDSYKK